MRERIFASPSAPPPTLAVRAPVAAKLLGISERLLATLTKSGNVPHVRCGRAVIYPVASLHEWLAKNSQPRKESH